MNMDLLAGRKAADSGEVGFESAIRASPKRIEGAYESRA
jgi:hypothetical protein